MDKLKPVSKRRMDYANSVDKSLVEEKSNLQTICSEIFGILATYKESLDSIISIVPFVTSISQVTMVAKTTVKSRRI